MLRPQDNVIDAGEHVKKAGDFASAVKISLRPATLLSQLQHPTLLQLTHSLLNPSSWSAFSLLPRSSSRSCSELKLPTSANVSSRMARTAAPVS